MKSFNSIVFLLSFVMVGTVFSMEEVPRNQGKEFVEVDNKLVEYYTGSNIRYYGEYRPQQRDNNIVSFPVGATDPLPIEYCGDTRFFVTSAKEGRWGGSFASQAFMILDPSISQLAVVRGESQSNGYKVDMYMGFEANKFKSVGYKGLNKIYSARVMTMHIRKKASMFSTDGRSEYGSYSMDNEVKHFGAMEIGQEVDKFFPKEEKKDDGKKTRGRVMPGLKWQTPVFQDQVKDLLGKRAQDFDFKSQHFNFRENYWTQEGNKLKGITYHSANK